MLSDLSAERAAVVHRFVLDRSYQEVGAALGCSVDAASAFDRAALTTRAPAR